MSKAKIRILQVGDETLLEAFLLPRIASSMFLLSNTRSAGLVDQGQPYQGTYAASLIDERIVAVVALYWNGNLMFQAATALTPLVRALLEATNRNVQGLIGPADQVQRAKNSLGIRDALVQMDEIEDLYFLDLSKLRVPADLASGKLSGRRIRPEDLDMQAKWRAEYVIEALGEADTPETHTQARRAIERSLREGRTWVLEHECEPVASSSFNAAIKEAVQVGGVWTPPALRSRGYGRAVVAASLLEARDAGADAAILFTGKENIPAQKAYLSLGFEIVGDYRLLLLREPFKPQV